MKNYYYYKLVGLVVENEGWGHGAGCMPLPLLSVCTRYYYDTVLLISGLECKLKSVDLSRLRQASGTRLCHGVSLFQFHRNVYKPFTLFIPLKPWAR